MRTRNLAALFLAICLVFSLAGCDLPQDISLGISSYSGTASIENPSSGTTDLSSEVSTSSGGSHVSGNTSGGNSATTTTSNSENNTNNNTTTSSNTNQGGGNQGGQSQGGGSQDDQSQGGGSYTAISEDKRYCYTSTDLSDKQKALYLNIRNAVKSRTTSLSLSTAADISGDDVRLVVQCVNTDFPEFYWMTGSYSLHYIGKTATKIDFQYLPSNDAYTAALESAVEKFCNSLPANLSDYDLELKAHDYLCKNITYDTATASGGTSNKYAYSAYGALVSKSCVCEGYARAMQLLMNRVGVQCSLVRGDADGSGHMWNIINIHDKWYHLDVTWDDPVNAPTYNHFYFNLTTAQILAANHTMDPGFVAGSEKGFNTNIPSCTNTAYNYFVKSNSLLNGSDDDAAALAALKAAKKSGKKSCEFRTTADSPYHGIQKSQEKVNAFAKIAGSAGIGSFSIITSQSPDCFMITWQ